MPPKAPSQAGKFKPVKRPTKPAAKPSATAAARAPEQSKQSGKSPGRERGDGRSKSPGRGGRGRGRGRGGRESTDGRGRCRGGRFVAPTGAAFFTGASTKQPDDVPSAHQPQTVATIAAGQDGAVVLPFTKPYSATSNSEVSRTAAESVAAAARAKLGEGEEIIIAEIDMADADEPKKVSVLEQPSRRDGMPSLFDDEYTSEIPNGVDDHYVYDSDSSQEETRRKKTREIGIRPIQLPFPLGSDQLPMYACQEDVEEKKDGMDGVLSSVAATQLVDPEVTPAFLDWSSPYTRDNMKFAERNSWFLMKFPTRLPHMDNGSLVGGVEKQIAQNPSGKGMVKSELNEDGLEIVGSNTEVVGDVSHASASGAVAGSIGSIGYDNTLKDISPGRYGKIVVRKSGRTELVIGGQDGEPEVWK